jgi:hypothetical protein
MRTGFPGSESSSSSSLSSSLAIKSLVRKLTVSGLQMAAKQDMRVSKRVSWGLVKLTVPAESPFREIRMKDLSPSGWSTAPLSRSSVWRRAEGTSPRHRTAHWRAVSRQACSPAGRSVPLHEPEGGAMRPSSSRWIVSWGARKLKRKRLAFRVDCEVAVRTRWRRRH